MWSLPTQVAQPFVPHGVQAQAGGRWHVRGACGGSVRETGSGPAEVEGPFKIISQHVNKYSMKLSHAVFSFSSFTRFTLHVSVLLVHSYLSLLEPQLIGTPISDITNLSNGYFHSDYLLVTGIFDSLWLKLSKCRHCLTQNLIPFVVLDDHTIYVCIICP